MYQSIHLHPFESYILSQFQNKNLYNDEIMNFLTSQGINQQESYFAISQLRAKYLLNTYYDYRGNQYFTLNSIGTDYLHSLGSNITVNYATTTVQNFAFEYPKPTQIELENIEQSRRYDEEIKRLTIDNFNLQKRKSTFDKIISVSTLITTILTLLYLLFPIQFAKCLDIITSKIATEIPNEKPVKK